MTMFLRALWWWLLSAALLPWLAAQDKPPGKDDDEVAKAAVLDPYTGGDAALMTAAGVVGYAPFPWADGFSTADIEKVLGERRVLWMETAHFRLGLALRSCPWPEQNDARKAIQDEVKALKKRLPKVAEKPKKLDPWLRMHLYAARCEAAYTRYQELLGVADTDFPKAEPFLGMPDKFLLLLFQKQSDMVRYMDRFCGRKDDSSMRFYHDKSRQIVLAVAVEAFDGIDEVGLHGHVLHGLWHMLLSGHGGYPFEMPPWLADGVAHWHARQIPGEFLNVQIRDDEAVADDKRNDWNVKARRRVQHEALAIPFATMAQWSKPEDMGYHAHVQSWARIDYLMQKDRAKVGELLRDLKGKTPGADFDGKTTAARAFAQQRVEELFGDDAASFDRKWREWVLKTYPKK